MLVIQLVAVIVAVQKNSLMLHLSFQYVLRASMRIKSWSVKGKSLNNSKDEI